MTRTRRTARDTVAPVGRQLRITNDARGRVRFEDVRDSAASVAVDRLEYAYDTTGRRKRDEC
jgi:hypothetical protein